MGQFSMEEAVRDIEHNRKRAQQNPEMQKEFHEEYMYSNPNDFDEMVKLHSYYGYKYSLSLWAYQQAVYTEASKATDERLKKEAKLKTGEK